MSALGQKQTCAVRKGMSALPPKATSIAAIGMSALCQKRTSQSLIPKCKQKDRLAAVSPKSDQVF